jgi:hypothetical protein
VVSFTPPAALPPGKQRQYPLDRRLSWPQNQSGHGDGVIPSPCHDSDPGSPARSPVPILTELSQLLSEIFSDINEHIS